MSSLLLLLRRIHWTRSLSLICAAFAIAAGGYIQTALPTPPKSFRELVPVLEPAAVAGVWSAVPLAVGLLVNGYKPAEKKEGEKEDGE